MATESRQLSRNDAAGPASGSVKTWAWAFVTVLIVWLIAHYAQMGAVSPRIANPEVTGVPRPIEALWGRTNWLELMQWGSVVALGALLVGCIVAWRRYPAHPYLLMVLASTAIVWQDPIMNWAPYAVYNPQLWHLPIDWPLASLSPTVEPFIVIGYATFYFGPFFPAIWILRRIQAHKSADSFVWRHPLLSLGALTFVVGFVMDAFLETFLIRTQLYIYAQVIPYGSIFVGKYYQFPLIWESTFVLLVMIPASLLCYRDDTGRTQAEKLAQRLRLFRGRPALATFLVMFGILNVCYFMYGAAFGTIRATKAATSVACPWPYPESKVYDPNGFYEREGQAGPYFEGLWSKWMSAQPSGRPTVNPPKENGHCRSDRG